MNRSEPGPSATDSPPRAEPQDASFNDATVESHSDDWHAARQMPTESESKSLPPRPAPTYDETVAAKVASDDSDSKSGRIVEVTMSRGRPSDAVIERFKADVRTLQALRHSGVLPVTNCIRDSAKLTVRMETPRGTSLESRLSEQMQPWPGVCELLQPVIETLAALHAAGVAHGGLRPRRIFLESDFPVLADVCVAQLEGSPLSGTPDSDEACLSPEQWSGRRSPLTPEMDVYAVGVILYRLLCGRYPFRTQSRMDLLRQVLEDPPQPPRQLTHTIPRALEELCLACLSREPTQRPKNGRELARRMTQILEEASESESFDSITSLSTLEPARPARTQPAGPARFMRIEAFGENGTDALPVKTVASLLELAGASRQESVEPGLILRLPAFATRDDWINWLANAAHCVVRLVHGRIRDGDAGSLRLRIHSMVRSANVSTMPHSEFVCRVEAEVAADAVSVTDDSIRFFTRGLMLPVRQATVDTTVLQADDGTELTVVTGPETPQPPLTGRTAQLAMLQSRWEQTCEGMGQVVLVMGDEGTGKSRLISELSDSARALAAAVSPIVWRCRPPKHGHAFHPLLEWLRAQLGPAMSSSPEEQRDVLNAVLRRYHITDPDVAALLTVELGLTPAAQAMPPLTETQRRQRLSEFLLTWISGLARHSPLLFVVEDLQWVDAATLVFLEQLVEGGSHSRLLTVLSCRSEFETPWGSRAHQTQVALNRLTTRHTQSLIEAVSGNPVDAAAIADIKTATGGIPLFLEHHARYRLAQ